MSNDLKKLLADVEQKHKMLNEITAVRLKHGEKGDDEYFWMTTEGAEMRRSMEKAEEAFHGGFFEAINARLENLKREIAGGKA